jgi:ketosteroid isomerase-like protein
MSDQLHGPDLEDLRQRLAGYYAGWGFEEGRAGSADARRFYAPERDLVLYDTQPPVEGFDTVEALHRGVADRAGGAGITSVRFAPDLDRIEAWSRGDIAWTLTPYRVTAHFPDGRTVSVTPTQTHVWERRDDGWRIVHEHTAPPSQYSALTPTGETVASLPGPRDAQADGFVDTWLAEEHGEVAGAVRRVGLGTPPASVDIARRGIVRMWWRNDAAWATYLVTIVVGGRMIIGRDTLIADRNGEDWRILLAHRSVPFMAAAS